MGVTNVLLTRRAVVQAAVETTYGVAATLTTSDGVLCNDPKYMGDPTLLERNYTRDTLSHQPHIMGRILAKMEFETELRANGASNSGLVADAPIIARLFRACGYNIVGKIDNWASAVYEQGDHANHVAWTVTSGAAATGTLTVSGIPTALDTVTIGSITYVWKASPTTTAYEVKIGASAQISIDNLVAAITGGAGSGSLYGSATIPHTRVTATRATSSTMTVTALDAGTLGNAIATTESGTNTAFGSATLTGGTAVGTNTDVIMYFVKVTTGGGSGAAQITVTSDTTAEGSAAASITTATPVTLGTKGLVITPVFTGTLSVGQSWIVWLYPPGIAMHPVSNNFESVTLAMYKDGVKHVMPGAFGTFEIDAEAGQFGKIKWTFTGTWVDPTDATMPVPLYERQLPHQVELARLRMEDYYAVVAKFHFTQGNDIQVRPDVNSAQGYIGTRIVGRKPEGGIDPEADLVASYDFWSKMRNAQRMGFQMRVGTVPGNQVWLCAPCTQYSGMTYTDRQGILTYDAGLKFSGYNGDDELTIFFC